MALLAAWNFDEASGSVVDHSGNSRGFALTGNTVRTADGGGHTLKGLTQSAADIQAGPAITGLNTTSRTIEMWAKITAGFTGWLLEYQRTAEATGVWGFLYLSGVLRFRAKDSSNNVYEVNFTAPDTNWHHYAATHDGTTLRAYRDGVQVGTGTAMAVPVWTADTFRVLDQSGSVAVIDDVRLYDTVLSAGAITTDMNTPVSSGAPAMAVNTRTLQYHMNRKAGTLVNGIPTRDAQAAANIWAGTTGKDLVGALNIRAGNTFPNYRDLAGVLNQLAGTTGLDVDGAAANIP